MPKSLKQAFRFDVSRLEALQKTAGAKLGFTPPLDISSITIRETDGDDERTALVQVRAKNPNANTNMTAELIGLAVVEVDDKPVSVPFLDYDSWNTRTRSLVLAAFNCINGVEAEETAAFFATATTPSKSSTTTTPQ